MRKPLRMHTQTVQDAAMRPVPLPPLSTADALERYSPPRTLGATEEHQLAMDAHLRESGFHSLLSHAVNLGMGLEETTPQFLGYAYLAGLSQNPIIRAGVTTVADEMTKRWVQIKDGDKRSSLKPTAVASVSEPWSDKPALDGFAGQSASRAQERTKVKALTAALADFGIQSLFNEAAQKCDFDGGCLIYIDTGETDERALQSELYLDAALLQGKVRRFTLVEAVNVYPGLYNATDPLSPDYFTPDSWMVLGRRIHASRFLYFAPNQVNILLRPSYNFFGIPAAQQALDYVAHFTKTREAAHRLLTKFSLTVFKTNMEGILAGGSGAHMDMRLQYLTQKRDNDAILVIDNEQEDVLKLETPLSGITEIVQQSLEFVAAIFRIPFVKFLGISPSGLNATGEADLRNFYDHVSSKQEKILRKPLCRIMDILQMHLFGEIDPHIRVEFAPLSDEDDAQKALTRKAEAERDATYLECGVLEPHEVRQRLMDDPDSDYGFIGAKMASESTKMECATHDSEMGDFDGVRAAVEVHNG